MSDSSKYNQWKRSTLNRLTQKYHAKAVELFERNLRTHEPAIKRAFEQQHDSLEIHDNLLAHDLLLLYKRHLHDVVWVGISDGLREVTPDKKLSTWMDWPIEVPVEDTIVSLSDTSNRASAFQRAFAKIYKRSRLRMAKNSKRQTKRYLKNITDGFKLLTKDYFEDENNETPVSMIKYLMKDVLGKTQGETERVFRTETTKYFNEARISYFKNHTDVDFVQLYAITDGRVSNICEARHLYVIPIGLAGQKQYSPPFHPNCRTIQSPLDTDLKSNQARVRENLGDEFGTVTSANSGLEFVGKRKAPPPLPKGWA